MRLDPNLPVVAACLFAAACAQELVPAPPQAPVKAVFLTAVGLYFALTRPVAMALTVLVWAGALTDALGGLPLACTLTFLMAVYVGVRLLQRAFLEATVFQGTLLVGCVSVVQVVWTRLWAHAGGPLFSWETLVRLEWALPVGMAAGFVGFAVCGLADRLSGNVRPVKESDGVLWAETNR